MLEQQLAVGRTYRFTFKSEFERHGFCQSESVTCLHKGNGIFRLEEIATFKDIVLAGIDLYSSFFKPLGIAEEEYKQYFSGKPMDRYEPIYTTVQIPTERIDPTTGQRITGIREQLVETGKSKIIRHFLEDISYGSFPIYKLVDVVDPDDVIYAPEKAIEGFPEVGIKEYQNLTLAVDIGYWADPTNLDAVLLAMRERLAMYGIQPLKISLFSADSLWMNPDEYAEMKSINVPGMLVQIPSDPVKQTEYLNKHAVIDGTIKTIVRAYPKDEQDHEITDGYVLISTLATDMNFCIDPNVFIDRKNGTEYKPIDETTDTVFESDNLYYTVDTISKEIEGRLVTINCFRKLVEGQDWVSGDAISHFKEIKDATAPATGTYYADFGPVFTKIPKTADRYAIVVNYIETGVPVYYKTDTNKYAEATKSHVDSHKGDEFYLMTSDCNYVGITINQGDSLTVKDHLYNLVRIPIYKTNYASDMVQSMIAKKYIYTNRFGSKVTSELSQEQIVNISTDESHSVRISNAVVKRKYNGRWFEFTRKILCGTTDYSKFREANRQYYRDVNGKWVAIAKDDPDLGEIGREFKTENKFYQDLTCAVQIKDNDDYKVYSEYDGVVLGEIGELYREVFIQDDDPTLNRNYFALYQKQLQDNQKLGRENEALRTIIAKLDQNN